MDEIIQIKCPFDGAILSVRKQPGIETKNVTCPICKHKYPFTQFKRVYSAPDNDETDYRRGAVCQNNNCEEKTEIRQPVNFSLGKVVLVGSGLSFQLRPGRNVIGRRGQKSVADFQIDTAEGRAMSREHVVIDVKRLSGKGFVHYISLYKEKVNKTFIGNEPLLYGDCIVLNDGDVIKLPDATLRFEISDGEKTEIK